MQQLTPKKWNKNNAYCPAWINEVTKVKKKLLSRGNILTPDWHSQNFNLSLTFNPLYLEKSVYRYWMTLNFLVKFSPVLGTCKLDICSICKCENCHFLMYPTIYRVDFIREKPIPSIFSTPWSDINLQLALVIPLDKWPDIFFISCYHWLKLQLHAICGGCIFRVVWTYLLRI